MTNGNAAETEGHLFVILGATGDLVGRKLLPSLNELIARDALGANSLILGVGVETEFNDDSFRARCCKDLADAGVPQDQIAKTVSDKRVFYQTIAKGTPEDYKKLAARVEQVEKENGLPGNRVFYLALPPKVFPLAIAGLGNAGLNKSRGWTRLVIEKPFGRDLASAQALNQVAHEHFEEKQIYRIDHYLGKETVQNLLVFRFANSLFEPQWNRDRIESVEITVAECLGVEHRAAYYEGAGALRDMIQNHLTQLLTLTAMEVPSAFQAEPIRHEKVKVLHSVLPIKRENVVLGQYAAGKVEGQDVAAYRDEPGVAKDSQTETFVAMRLEIENWRWHGVPFFLRTGKRLEQRMSQIVVNFRRPPVWIFKPFDGKPIDANALVIAIQPDEGFDLYFEIKAPGQGVQIERSDLHFRYSEKFKPLPDAYETLLLDVIHGDPTLFVSDSWVEASWTLYTPVLENKPKVLPYAAGSWGPAAAADALLSDLGRTWTRIL
ncbi:MAG TPA: glucose-6-phosphate dehydrogenase [Candidatus Acidoferrales bacterium]|nr:glucose-6-phosphate dehydrogenase [Candidatus Acidoferrales bacterium]